MKTFVDRILTFCTVLACVLALGSCSILGDDDESDSETVNTLLGIWVSGDSGTGRWRLEFVDDKNVRITNYYISIIDGKLRILQDGMATYTAADGVFDMGYYGGRLISDTELSFDTRLADYDDLRMRKVADDNFDELLEEAEQAAEKERVKTSMAGLWEGLSNDGTYVRSLELNKQDNGAFSSVDITYKAEGAYWPNMFFGWDIDLDANRFTLFGTATSDDDEIGEFNLEDSVIVMPTVTLRKTAKVINDPQAVNAAVGVWTSDDDQRIELRADMTVTYSNGWMTYDYDEWRTADNEVQLFLAGRDHYMFYTARFVLSGDELIEFPGFDECRHFRRAEE